MSCESFGLNSLPIERPKANNSVILGEIIINFINKYFDEDDKFVSLIFKTSKNNEADFSHDLYNVLEEAKLPHVIFDKLNNATYDNRNAFNLIVIDDLSTLS